MCHFHFTINYFWATLKLCLTVTHLLMVSSGCKASRYAMAGPWSRILGIDPWWPSGPLSSCLRAFAQAASRPSQVWLFLVNKCLLCFRKWALSIHSHFTFKVLSTRSHKYPFSIPFSFSLPYYFPTTYLTHAYIHRAKTMPDTL